MTKINRTVLRNMVICAFVIGLCTGVVFLTNNAYARVSLTDLQNQIINLQNQIDNFPPGPQGDPGPPGVDGQDGLNCWDLNGDSICNPYEDTNNDGHCDAYDCQGGYDPQQGGSITVNRLYPGSCYSPYCPTCPAAYGWCPDGTKIQFIIEDDAIINDSVIVINLVDPYVISHTDCEAVLVRNGEGIGKIEPRGEFTIICENPPSSTCRLHYAVINP